MLVKWLRRYDLRVPKQQDPKRSPPGLLSGDQVTPLDLDAVKTVRVGTALWVIALLVMLPFTERLTDSDRGWWLWTCVAGIAIGVMGIGFTTGRRKHIRRSVKRG